MKFKKKPVVIEAFQMTRDLVADYGKWPAWLTAAWLKTPRAPGSMYPRDHTVLNGELAIRTLEGEHVVSWDDWIIQGVAGELYPCKPDIFEQTYEAVP